MELLKNLNLFSKEFNFTTFKESRYSTYLGLFFSLSLLGIFIISMIYFGNEFYTRKNPVINFQNIIGNSYSKSNLTNQDFLIPWAIVDSNSKIVNLTGKIYPLISYYKFNRLSDGSYQPTYNVNLTWTQCSNLNDSRIFGSMKSFNCLNLNDLNLTFGGGWDNEFVDFFAINFYYCDNFGNFKSDGNCTSLENLTEFLNSNQYKYFSIFYPNLHFFPDSLENPLQIEYTNYFNRLNLGLIKVDSFTFEKIYIFDDQGWFFSENKTKSIYSIANRQSSFSLIPISEFNSPNTDSLLYSIVFSIGKNFSVYKRSFSKLQNLLAIVGGIINIIQTIFSLIHSFIDKHLKEVILINEIFDYKKKNLIENKFYSFLEINPKKDFSKKSESIELKNSQILDSPKLIAKNSQLQKSKINDMIQEKVKDIIIFRNKEFDMKLGINPGFYLIIKHNICLESCLNVHEKSKLAIFQIAQEYIKERLDIFHYIKVLQVIDKLKMIILNYYQNVSLEFINKRDLSLGENIEIISRLNNRDRFLEINQIVEYYSQKFNDKTMTEIDSKIYEILDQQIKFLIDLKISKE